MLKLRLLLVLQSLFAMASIAFLLASMWREQATGEPLSAAPLVPSLIMFAGYCGALLLPRLGRVGWYRVAMVLAIVFFGGGGVIGNIVRYVETGLAHYASYSAWLIAVGINAYGTVLNIVAALGLFSCSENRQIPS